MLDFTHFACKMENSIKSVRIQIRFVGSPELLLILSFSFFFPLSLYGWSYHKNAQANYKLDETLVVMLSLWSCRFASSFTSQLASRAPSHPNRVEYKSLARRNSNQWSHHTKRIAKSPGWHNSKWKLSSVLLNISFIINFTARFSASILFRHMQLLGTTESCFYPASPIMQSQTVAVCRPF